MLLTMEYLPSLQQEFDEFKPSLFGKFSLAGNVTPDSGNSRTCIVANKDIAGL